MNAGGAEHGAAVAAIFGCCIGAIEHSLLDIFYIVPVELFWPHNRKFEWALFVPAEAAMASQDFKARTPPAPRPRTERPALHVRADASIVRSLTT